MFKTVQPQGIFRYARKRVHRKLETFKCEMCFKEFGQKCNLKKHYSTIHDKANATKKSKAFKCD